MSEPVYVVTLFSADKLKLDYRTNVYPGDYVVRELEYPARGIKLDLVEAGIERPITGRRIYRLVKSYGTIKPGVFKLKYQEEA